MRRFIIPLLAMALIAGCHHEAPTEDIDKAAAQFFLRLQSAQYDQIYDEADENLKEQKPRAAVIDDLQKLMPDVKDPQLKAMMQETLPALKHHRDMAQSLLQKQSG